MNSKEQANTSPERGFWPDESIQERGEEEDKVFSATLSKRITRKKKGREISVTDIMPNIKSKLRADFHDKLHEKNSMDFIKFSKQFSHFVVFPIFLSYLDVSDYLEIRKGWKYLRDCYDYGVLENFIKFGNLDEALRKNLWTNVCPIFAVQNKYRRKLGIDTVFCNIYTIVLENAEATKELVTRVDKEVEEYKNSRSTLSKYDQDDFEVIRNLALAFYSLFPENRSK